MNDDGEDMTALFDMDATLFDYDGQMRRDLQALASPGEEIPEDLHDDDALPPWWRNRIDRIKSTPGWWRALPRYEPGFQILRAAQDVGFCCSILTKGPRSRSQAWAEKVQCIDHHFGEEMPIDVVGRTKKRTYGRVLVDDYPAYVLPWLKHRPRGLVIMPAYPYNLGCAGHPSIIRYDGTNLPEVVFVLCKVRDRKSGEDWK